MEETPNAVKGQNGEGVFPSPVDWDHGEHDWGRKRFLRIFLSENPPLVNKIVLNVAKCCVIELLTHTHTHPFTALCPGLPGWARTRKVKPIWILLKQETVASAGPYASVHLAPER